MNDNQVIEVQVKDKSGDCGCCVGGFCLVMMVLLIAALACTPFFLF